MTEIIEIQNTNTNGEWQPFVGDETIELLRSKGFANADKTPNESGERILNETYRIMQVCGNPYNPTNNETGIVIGYVQSGKTLSFTTLTALARDNNYKIVIVIAGVSTNLVNQSTNRLSNDLRLNTRFDKKWTLLQNPSRMQDAEIIETALAQWADPTFPKDRCRTLLITVMKNTSHLNNLVGILQGQNLQGVPTLIIDDEGDQASLNTRARWAARQGIEVENLTENQ
ncbi:MAG TPA: alpha-1,4 polygalactosaminidase, partial [Chitinophagaceae bacterium]|nr:alpha-1,4 polygalactosaminidase [Chitinophagaceae bacterium]